MEVRVEGRWNVINIFSSDKDRATLHIATTKEEPLTIELGVIDNMTNEAIFVTVALEQLKQAIKELTNDH